MAKYVSAYEGAKRDKEKKKKYVSAYSEAEKNKYGIPGAVGYIAARAGTDFLRVGEGALDAALVPVDLLMGNVDKAKSRFMDSPVDAMRERLDEEYNPGKGMQVVGDIAGGIGQSIGYGLISAIPYAGKPIMYSSIIEQGISSAAKQTGNVGLKEIGYGVTTGAIEGALESKLGAGVNAAKGIGSAILKKSGVNVAQSAAKVGGNSMLKSVLAETAKGAAGEFAEEAISEAVDPALLRLYNIDENAQGSLGNVLYAGVIGALSGGIVSAGPAAINYNTSVKVGRSLQEQGLDVDLVKRARYTLQGFEIANQRAEAAKGEVAADDKKAAKAAKRNAKQISKETAELADKIEKNIAAYERYRADPKTRDADATAAILGELRGNLFLVGMSYEVDTVEAVIKQSDNNRRQQFVDVINEMMAAQGKKHDYTLADLDNDTDQIRRKLAGQLTLESLMGVDGAQSPAESQEDAWAGMPDGTDFTALGATGEAETTLLREAINWSVPKASVSEMLNQYRKGTNLTPAEFAEGWADGAHIYGRFGFDTKGTEKTAFGRMEPEAREAAMKYGRDNAEAETKAHEEAAKEKKKPAAKAEAEGKEKSEKTSGKETEGKVKLGEGLKGKQIREAFPHEGQFEAYKASEILSKVLGTDIVIEASMDSVAGRVTNGFYKRGTNAIHININAMRDGKSVALYTLAHEVTHYIKEWSPAKFKILSDFVMGKMGGDAKTLIDEKVSLLRSIEDYKDLTVAELNDLAAEEVVADGMELILTDGKVLEELAREDKTLWEKIRDWVMEIIGQIRRSFESLSGASKTAQVLRETMDTLDEIERLFAEGVREAGERTRKAGVTTEDQTTEKKMSFTPADYEKPITLQDIEVLRSIGRKSINAFTSEDIEKAQKWAYKFYKEMGTKSPFFRAWFGDWRVYDRSNFVEILEMEQREGKNPRGEYKNRDTGWVINSSSVGYDETVSHSGKDKKSLIAMRNIDKIIENAILLDTEVSEYGRGKKSVYTAFMHKLYAPIRIDGKMYLAKLSVEESNAPGQSQIDKKFYHVRAIKIETASSVGIGESHTPIIEDTASDISIAQLFETVKTYDKEFSPNPVNELMLNEDGTPKVFYHGTNAEFTVFDVRKSRIGAFGKGFYLSPSKTNAKMYGSSRIIESYVDLQNPYVVEDSLGLDYDTLQKMQNDLGESQRITDKNAMAVLKKHNYDGIVVMNNGRIKEIVVYDPKKIKSATDNMGTFDGTNPDIRYSLGEAENGDVRENEAEAEPTDREMLLAMAEQLVGSEEENKIVSNYKAGYDTIREKQDRIDELTARQRDLQSIMFTGEDAKARSDAAKELRSIHEEMNTLLEDVADADRKLTEIEGMKVIRNLIQRERLAVRDTYKNKYETMYKRRNEARDTTETRRSVRRLYNRVNRLLFSPTKTRNVPIGMQSIVAEALRAANVDAEAIERLGQLEEQLAKLEQEPVQDLEKMADLEQRIEAQEKKVGKIKDQVSMMIEIFEATNDQNADGETRLVFDETVLQKLKDLRTEIGNASIRNMDRKQLQALKDFYDMIWHRIKVANNTLASNRKLEINKVGEQSSREVRDSKALKILSPKSMELVGAQTARKYIWSLLKPLTAFEVLGSDTFMSLFREVLNGEDVWARDLEEAFDFIQESKKKHKYDDWDMIKRQTVETAQGSVDLSLSEIMSLYAYSFREQAKSHLMGGGFVLDPNATARVKGKKLTFVELERRLNNPTRYTLTEKQITELGSYLTDAQRAYVEEVQGYLTGMGEKGNQVSRKLYGIDIFREEHYFPIKVKSEYLESQLGKTGDPKIKNQGMTKEIVPEAKNPLVLQDFMAVAGDHINSMATYHAFVLPVEDLTRVLNFKPTNVKLDADGNPVLDENGMPVADENANVRYDTLKSEIEAKYGAEAVSYIEQLLRDLNGGARRDAAATLMDQGLTAFKRAATMMSLSTIVQQPTSVFRAMAYVDHKWFRGAKKYDYEIVKRYAPVAVMKEIGGFDTGTGMRTTEYLNKKEYKNFNEKLKAAILPESKGGDPAYRAELFGWLTGKADEITWSYLFGACVNEQAAKLKKPASSEEVLKAAGERFADVVRRTQVYDSTLTRNQMMRSKDTGAKLLTQFGAEPATVVSMIVDGLVRSERGDKTFFRKTAAPIAASIIINAMVSSLIYALRDDDEEKNLFEKYLTSLTGEIIEGFNPLEYLPIFRDIMSLFKGYDVERSDMTLIGNLFDQIELITSSNRSVPDKLFGVSGAVASFFGVPVTNVYRDVKGIVKTALSFSDAEPMTGGGAAGAMGEGVRGQFNLLYKVLGVQEGNAFELYKAALRGDTAHYDRVAARYETASDAEQALRRELRENDKRINQAAQAKLDGDLDVYESIIEKIEGEGHFDRNLIIRAINNEVMSIKDAAKQATATKEEIEEEEEIDEALYSATDLADSLERGDTEDYESIYEYLIAYKTELGQTEAQARAAIKSSMTAKYKKLYLEAWKRNDSKEMKRILALLEQTELYGTYNDAAKTVEKWVRDANK